MPPDPARKPREWAPRFWNGADFFAWLRLLARNRFDVEFPYWYIAGIVTGVTFANTCLRWLQHARFADRLAAGPGPPAPVFVLGHWRTGTTLLHELLILDPRHTSPTTLACLNPCHFLLTGEFYRRRLGFLLPGRRPMDNMAFGWDRPQEDEFALALLGQPTTYTDVAFPNRPPLDPGALDLSGLSARELAGWKRAVKGFVRALAVADPRRPVLKSPPHTARVPVLLDLFPGAKFVHLSRDPYTLFASTVHLWTSLARKHGLQTPRDPAAVEEKVFREFRVIHARYQAAKRLIPPGDLVEVRYEDLVGDLVGGTERVYAGLGLGGWDAARPGVEGYAARAKGYEPNKYQLTPEDRAKVRARWGDIIDQLGYEHPEGG